MTGEKKLSDLAGGAILYPAFLKEITAYTAPVTMELLSLGGSLASIGYTAANANKPPCPKCKKGFIRKGEKNYWCTACKEGCDFKIWFQITGKKLTDNQVKLLLTKGRKALLKGLISKSGNSFDAVLKLDKHYKISFDFEKKVNVTLAPVICNSHT